MTLSPSPAPPESESTHDKWRLNPFHYLLRARHAALPKKAFRFRQNACHDPLSMDCAIFGVPLETALQCSTMTERGLSVPTPVYLCINTIIERGLRTEGLFRLSGAVAQVEELCRQLNQPPYGRDLDMSQFDIHTVTSVLKQYLRQLPGAVIPVEYHDQFMVVADEPTAEASKPEIAKRLGFLISDIPLANRHLLYYILMLAADIQKHEDENMMNPEALAVVLAPACTGFEHALRDIPYNQKKKKVTKGEVTDLVLSNQKWTFLWMTMIEHHAAVLSIRKIHRSLPTSHRTSSLPPLSMDDDDDDDIECHADKEDIPPPQLLKVAQPCQNTKPAHHPTATPTPPPQPITSSSTPHPGWLNKDPYPKKSKSRALFALSINKSNRRILRRIVSATSLRSSASHSTIVT